MTSGRCVWLFSAWTRTAALQRQAKFKSRYSCSTAQRTEIPQGWRGDFCNLRNTHSSFHKIVGNTVLLCCYRSCECTDRINQAKRAMEKSLWWNQNGCFFDSTMGCFFIVHFFQSIEHICSLAHIQQRNRLARQYLLRGAFSYPKSCNLFWMKCIYW